MESLYIKFKNSLKHFITLGYINGEITEEEYKEYLKKVN